MSKILNISQSRKDRSIDTLKLIFEQNSSNFSKQFRVFFLKHFSKMKVSFIFILLLSSFLIHSNGHITIEIEPDDLHQISEILEAYIQRKHHQSLTRSPLRRAIVPLLKTVSSGIVQLFGIIWDGMSKRHHAFRHFVYVEYLW